MGGSKPGSSLGYGTIKSLGSGTIEKPRLFVVPDPPHGVGNHKKPRCTTPSFSSVMGVGNHIKLRCTKYQFDAKYKNGHSSSHRASQKLSTVRFGSKLHGVSFLDNCEYARTYANIDKNTQIYANISYI